MASEPKQPTATSAPADLANLPPDQMAAIVAASGATPIHGPVANASNTLVMRALNDALIVFGRPRPLLTADGQFANVATTETVAIIHMSMPTLKDFHWALGEQLRQYEVENGEIITEGMKIRAAQKK